MQYRQYDYYVRLGYDAQQRHNYQASYEYFLKAQTCYPYDSQIAYYLGLSAYNVKHFDVAVLNLEKAANTPGPAQSTSLYYLASALMALGSQELSQGNRDAGKTKLDRARKIYVSVTHNPGIPQDLRKMASGQLNRLDAIRL
jgi:tetratricopeptide (TPR) repeat protein